MLVNSFLAWSSADSGEIWNGSLPPWKQSSGMETQAWSDPKSYNILRSGIDSEWKVWSHSTQVLVHIDWYRTDIKLVPCDSSYIRVFSLNCVRRVVRSE